jgi:hypothetical protein
VHVADLLDERILRKNLRASLDRETLLPEDLYALEWTFSRSRTRIWLLGNDVSAGRRRGWSRLRSCPTRFYPRRETTTGAGLRTGC